MAENYRPQLLALFENNPNRAYEFEEIHQTIGGDYKTVYNHLQYLVRCKIVVKALPGLCGGRKNTYFKKK